jgi:hypothetical protein
MQMNEDVFNLEIRKFLKMVGINAQRDIEKVVRESIRNGTLSGEEKLVTTMTLEIPALGMTRRIEGTVALDSND